MALRDYTVMGTTSSLCPECLALVPVKIIVKGKRVYFRKTCPTHGQRDDYICSDVSQYDQLEYQLPGRIPAAFGLKPKRGCPYDCGLCTDHEQHTCVGLVEITGNCNLTCPTCYASSAPGGKHLSVDACKRAIDRLVEVEGRPEVVQLSGGEPTIHPQFEEILQYACAQPIDVVMVNTNGLRIAQDKKLLALLASVRKRIEIYLQFDGLTGDVYQQLRGLDLLAVKLKAVEALGEANINTMLVTTVEQGVNDQQLGEIVKFGITRPWITGISFQPTTYSGRYVMPEVLERRMTFPDVIAGIAEQTEGMFQKDDFMPLPCAHPNCHSITYAYRANGVAYPLMRFIDAKQHLDLLANGITFNRASARELIESYLGRLGCCGGGDCCSTPNDSLPVLTSENLAAWNSATSTPGKPPTAAEEFFSRAVAEDLSPKDVFRITITSFLDKYNFDVRRVMKCCIHHVLPSGHVIPFCAYNVLYREGHVPLPTLQTLAGAAAVTRSGE